MEISDLENSTLQLSHQLNLAWRHVSLIPTLQGQSPAAP